MLAQNGTNSKKYNLTAKQKKLAEALINPDFSGTVSELCNKLGVPRRTYYNWLDNIDFQEYVSDLIDKFSDSELSTVWKALIFQCSIGNIKAIKLYFELREKNKGISLKNVKQDDDPLTASLMEEAERLNNGDQ